METEKRQVCKLSFFEDFRLKINGGDFNKTEPYCVVDLKYPFGEKQEISSLWHIPIPSSGIPAIKFPDGKTIVFQQYNINKLKMIKGEKLGENRIDRKKFESLIPKGTLALKDKDGNIKFKLVLQKLSEPNQIHFGDEELYVYCPKKFIVVD